MMAMVSANRRASKTAGAGAIRLGLVVIMIAHDARGRGMVNLGGAARCCRTVRFAGPLLRRYDSDMSPRTKPTHTPVPRTTPREAPALPVGTHVQVTKGAWAGVIGIVDKLTTSVGGGHTTIVLADAPVAGEKDVRYLPRTRLVVVDNQHVSPVDGPGNQKVSA